LPTSGIVIWRGCVKKWIAIAFVLAALGAAWAMFGVRSSRYDTEIGEAARKYGLEPALLKALVQHQSGFDVRKVSPEGRRGLLQLSENDAARWAAANSVETFMPQDLFDARTNLDAGAWRLSRAKEHWKHRDDPTVFALAEFFASRRSIEEWSGEYTSKPDTAVRMLSGYYAKEVQRAVDDVLKQRELYRKQ
jgi:soluble lytic murein transglycosylase-like protein